jgi:hypothetical protein
MGVHSLAVGLLARPVLHVGVRPDADDGFPAGRRACQDGWLASGSRQPVRYTSTGSVETVSASKRMHPQTGDSLCAASSSHRDPARCVLVAPLQHFGKGQLADPLVLGLRLVRPTTGQASNPGRLSAR